jgi:hypothetical protein
MQYFPQNSLSSFSHEFFSRSTMRAISSRYCYFMENRYQSQTGPNILSDYCWTICREADSSKYKRNSRILLLNLWFSLVYFCWTTIYIFFLRKLNIKFFSVTSKNTVNLLITFLRRETTRVFEFSFQNSFRRLLNIYDKYS